MSEQIVDRLLYWSVVAAIGLGLFNSSELLAAPSQARSTELIRLVREDCGSCHGLRLSGGIGPSLLPSSLKDKSPDMLVATILQGRPGTPMPGWAPFLAPSEARWVVDRLQEGFPEMHADGR